MTPEELAEWNNGARLVTSEILDRVVATLEAAWAENERLRRWYAPDADELKVDVGYMLQNWKAYSREELVDMMEALCEHVKKRDIEITELLATHVLRKDLGGP